MEEEDFYDNSENSDIDLEFLENRLKQFDEQINYTKETFIDGSLRAKVCKCGNSKHMFCETCKEGVCRECLIPSHKEKGHTCYPYEVLKAKVRKESSELFSRILATVQEVKELISTPSTALDKELCKARVAKRVINRMSMNFFRGVSKDIEETMMKTGRHVALQGCYMTLTTILNEMKRTIFSEVPMEYYEKFYDGEEQSAYFKVLKIISENRDTDEEYAKVQVELKKECISQVYELLHDMMDLRIIETNRNRTIKVEPPINSPKISKIAFYIPEKSMICLMKPAESRYSERILLKSKSQLPIFSELVMDEIGNIYFVGNSFKLIKNGPTLPSKNTYKFSVEDESFTQFADLIVERSKCCCLFYNNCIYLFGGFVTYSQIRTRTCEVIDLTENEPKWKAFPSLITPRVCASACTFTKDGKDIFIYVFGGLSDPSSAEKSIERYSFSTGQWEKVVLKNSVCYYPMFNTYSMQINADEILIFGGMAEKRSKQKSRKVIVLRTNSMCVESHRDILPLGVAKEGRTSQPIFLKGKILICNALQGQIYPNYQQLISDFYVCDVSDDLVSKIVNLEMIE